MKKPIALILSAMLIFLTACGGEVSETTTAEIEAVSTAAVTTTAGTTTEEKTEAATITTTEEMTEATTVTATEETTTVTTTEGTTVTTAETTVTEETTAAVTEPTTAESTTAATTAETTAATTAETTTAEVTTSAPVTAHKGFYVDGTKLFDANGNEFILRGINYPHTWFTDKLDISIPAIADTGANCVRIVLSDGGQWNKNGLSDIKNVIEKCRENNLIAILEVHDATGYDDAASLELAADYWIEMKDALIGNEAYVILNIANEWYGGWKEKPWRDGYLKVIPKIREAGIENTIMVDSAGWGQYAKSVAKYGKDVFECDPLGNTCFSVHMYGAAGKNKSTIKSAIEGATKKGLCIVVGEFGYTHSDGDVDEAYILKYCTDNGIGYMGWSWKGNSGGVEYLDIADTWDGSVLSPDWGEVLINGENGIRSTSKICTVFE